MQATFASHPGAMSIPDNGGDEAVVTQGPCSAPLQGYTCPGGASSS